MRTLWQDVRYGFRMLVKNPGFTATIIVTLALGLGVNLTVFLFVSDFFLRPLPVKDPERLAYVMQATPRSGFPLGFSFPDYQDFRNSVEGQDGGGGMASAFEGLLAYRQMPVALSRGAVAERAWVAAVSDNFFEVLGVGAARGRVFAPGEGRQPGADPIIVLTHDGWQERFGGDPGIIGQPLLVNGLSFTVVGVTPPGFHGPQWTDALSGIVPFTMIPQLQPADSRRLENRGQLGNMVMGRLRPGVTVAQARATADVVLFRLIAQYSEEHLPAQALIIPERLSRPSPAAVSYTPIVISVLMLGALLVLAIAIINVMNLLFARTADRERELAVRSALGASRTRLVRQVLVETSLLALIAGGLGVWLAHEAGAWLNSFMAFIGDVPPAADYGADWRVFACTAGLSLLAGTIAALVPALKATRQTIVAALKEGTPTPAAARRRLHSLLVVGQVALSCVVLVAAGLGVRSAGRLAQVNPGFQTENLLLASYDLGLQRYVLRHGLQRAQQFHRDLLEQVRALPGVRAASAAEHVPFDTNPSFQGGVVAEGTPAPDDSRGPLIPVEAVEYNYLQTLGVRLVDGRHFALTDNADAPRIAIVNEAMARRLWPDGKAVGRRILLDGTRGGLEVVGVIGSGRYLALADSERPYVFLPLAQNFRGGVTLVIRTEGDALALAGIYGLVSFNVARRTREIGLRMALGAGARDAVRLVIRQSVTLTLLGLVVGLPLALLAVQPLRQLLYGVQVFDLVTFLSVAFGLVGVALIACWIPARRAAKIDPMVALRTE